MPPLKKAHKVVKEEKTTEEQRIQFIINSQYHFMIPMLNAEHIRVRNPITGLDHHFSTKDVAFAEMLWQLCQKGMEDKIYKDLHYFAENYDSRWNDVIQFINGFVKAKQTQTAG